MNDVYSFKERFDNYIFIDSKSNEYPALVEFSPYQRCPKNFDSNTLKKDSKLNTIEQDSDYLKFLETFSCKNQNTNLPSCEAILEELEQKEREKASMGILGTAGMFNTPKIATPLLEYLKKKKDEKKFVN